jgi:hypothetical protein
MTESGLIEPPQPHRSSIALRRLKSLKKVSEPHFRELETHGRLAARRRRPATASMSRPIAQALRGRTAGRSAGVGRRSALTGTATTATVLPVMLKNSTE